MEIRKIGEYSFADGARCESLLGEDLFSIYDKIGREVVVSEAYSLTTYPDGHQSNICCFAFNHCPNVDCRTIFDCSPLPEHVSPRGRVDEIREVFGSLLSIYSSGELSVSSFEQMAVMVSDAFQVPDLCEVMLGLCLGNDLIDDFFIWQEGSPKPALPSADDLRSACQDMLQGAIAEATFVDDDFEWD